MDLVKELKNSYEKIAEVFNKSREKPWIELLRIVQKYAYKVVIDLGCGVGANTLYIIDNFRYSFYVGCDFAFNMVKKLKTVRNLGKIDVINCDIRYLPIRENSCDLIISIATIHHIPSKNDRIKVIQECFKILKRRGKLLVTVWSCSALNKLRRYVKINECDVLIPWSWGLNQQLMRYYHLYDKTELLNEFCQSFIKFKIVSYGIYKSSGFENYFLICEKT